MRISNQVNVDWKNVLSSIEDLYRNVEKEALMLPAFSLMPLFLTTWSVIKFGIFLFLDFFILVPMNTVIFVRNLFPGHWRYRSFSWPYIKYVCIWIWRGEMLYSPIATIGPLVRLAVALHIKNNLKVIKKHIDTDEDISGQEREKHLSNINKLIERWNWPGTLHILLTHIIPLFGSAIQLFRSIFPGELPEWFAFLGITLLGYTFGFVITAFMTKRGIMLGASGRLATFPGAIEGTGKYKNERNILSSAKILKSEFPWDIVLAFIIVAISYLTFDISLQIYESIDPHLHKLVCWTPPQQTRQNIIQIIQIVVQVYLALFCLLLILSNYRRNILGRK